MTTACKIDNDNFYKGLSLFHVEDDNYILQIKMMIELQSKTDDNELPCLTVLMPLILTVPLSSFCDDTVHTYHW